MKALFCGDIVGRSGREAVLSHVPELRKRLDLDFVFANGENAAGGFGITPAIARDFYDAGVDCLTTGNHVWDQREIIAHIGGDPKLLRPINYPKGTPGRGIGVYQARGNRKVVVINVMTRLFMDPLDDPFQGLEAALAQHRLGRGGAAAIFIDVHGEATSEKQALGYIADGRASLVVGSHSHVPTADARIMPGGTGYQTDAGMCGDYDSIIGMKKDVATQRFVRKMPGERLSPADGPGTLCAVYVELDDDTGHARKVAPVRMGGALAPTLPE